MLDLNFRAVEDDKDWRENQNYPWRYSPLTMCVLLAATLVVVAVYNLLRG
jgi:hypothetical protein